MQFAFQRRMVDWGLDLFFYMNQALVTKLGWQVASGAQGTLIKLIKCFLGMGQYTTMPTSFEGGGALPSRSPFKTQNQGGPMAT